MADTDAEFNETMERINEQYTVAAERPELGANDPPASTGPRPKSKTKTESSK